MSKLPYHFPVWKMELIMPASGELTKTSRKVSRKEAEKKKESKRKTQKRKSRRPRPTLPANCVATWKNCKPPSPPCCDVCTFCHCRLFQTVCYCRVGNPNC
ncbi:agouti-signaling protein isoform X2 [Mauremys reevesii]|uniref:agouti-signaling protein isoform X2 n=1 Tax=Mauremys reevesii TaxID=260615 RepID=UPI00193ECA12|nr:agouti-signaling protein isoform X2 [Mauremys reevesii]